MARREAMTGEGIRESDQAVIMGVLTQAIIPVLRHVHHPSRNRRDSDDRQPRVLEMWSLEAVSELGSRGVKEQRVSPLDFHEISISAPLISMRSSRYTLLQ
jgi:hypothetical protein